MVVSLPATTIRKRKAMISSSVSRSPSMSLSRRLEQRAGEVVGRRTPPLVDHVGVVADQPSAASMPAGGTS